MKDNQNLNLTILVVEDDIFATKYLIGILKKLGFTTVLKSDNAADALEIVKSHTIDLVFMDININGAIDGIRCANILNEQYFLPIIFTTAYSDSLTIKEASKTNIFSYITKPFEPHDVEASIHIVLNRLKFFQKNTIQCEEPSSKTIVNLGNDQTYNKDTKIFLVQNIAIDLTKKEIEILDFLCNNLNQYISYDIFKEKVWQNTTISNSTIRDSISRLKKKLPNLNLSNIVNIGYVLKV